MKIIKELIPLITENPICPFCKITLIGVNTNCKFLFCETKDYFCPYFTVLRKINNKTHYNTLELFILNTRVRFTKTNKTTVTKCGEFLYMPLIILPIQKLNVNDFTALENKIKTILTFS